MEADPTTFARTPAPAPAALVVSHEVTPGAEWRYEAWLKKVRAQCRTFRGHLGAEVIRPTVPGAAYTVIVRFDTVDHLETWLHSQPRRSAIEEVQPILAKADSPTVHSGVDVWFAPSSGPHRAPKKFKQYLLTVAIIFPLSVLVPEGLELLASAAGVRLPGVLAKLMTAIVLVALMVWIIFPILTARLRTWLSR